MSFNPVTGIFKIITILLGLITAILSTFAYSTACIPEWYITRKLSFIERAFGNTLWDKSQHGREDGCGIYLHENKIKELEGIGRAESFAIFLIWAILIPSIAMLFYVISKTGEASSKTKTADVILHCIAGISLFLAGAIITSSAVVVEEYYKCSDCSKSLGKDYQNSTNDKLKTSAGTLVLLNGLIYFVACCVICCVKDKDAGGGPGVGAPVWIGGGYAQPSPSYYQQPPAQPSPSYYQQPPAQPQYSQAEMVPSY